MPCFLSFITPPAPASGPTTGGTNVAFQVFCAIPDFVRFDGVDATNIIATPAGPPTTWDITCDAPAHAAGFVDVEIENTFAGQTDLLPNAFEYIAVPPPSPPNTKNAAGDDTLVDPPQEPGTYSRVIVKLLDDNELPETKYNSIKQQFLSANPGFSTRDIRVTWLRTVQEDQPSGQRKALYRITAVEVPQDVTVEFSLPTSNVPEDTPLAQIGLTMVTGDGMPLKQTCVVKVRDLLTGTATSGVDYAEFPDLEVLFFAGSPSGTTQFFTVGPIDDLDPEPDETINFELFSPVYCTLGAQTTHELTINDNDAVATIYVQFQMASDFAVIFPGPLNYVLNVMVWTADIMPTAQACSVDVADNGAGTAVPPADYDVFGVQVQAIPMGTPDGTLYVFGITNIVAPPFPKSIILDLQNNVGCDLAVPSQFTLSYQPGGNDN